MTIGTELAYNSSKFGAIMKYTIEMKKIALLGLLAAFGLQMNAQAQKPATDWYHKDLEKDGIQGISVDRAYEEVLKGRESKTVIVAVVDSGIDYNHEDLKNVMWTNPGEIPGNGIDDDKNGYIDDIHGWNFIGGADGNVQEDNLELTRLYRELSPRFDGKSEDDIAKGDQDDYALWLKVKEDFDASYSKAKQNYDQYAGMKDYYIESIAWLKEKTGKEDYTAEEIAAVEAEGDEETAMKEFLAQFVGMDFLHEIQGALDYFGGNVNYYYNVDFDPRNIVGDNYADYSEKFYGNNDVDAPDASHGTHVAGIIGAERNNGLGLGGYSEEGLEATNKHVRYLREHGARKSTMVDNYKDVFCHLWMRSSPLVCNLDRERRKKTARTLVSGEIETLVESLFLSDDDV